MPMLDHGLYGTFMISWNAMPSYPEYTGERWLELWKSRLEKDEPWTIRWLEHQVDGEYWRPGSVKYHYDKVTAATFLIDGWRDGYPSAAVRMYQKLNIPTLGVIENMSHFVCPHCHHEADIFGHGGGQQMAEQLGVAFIGRIPIYQPIREGSDNGVPLVMSEPDSVAAKAFMAAAERVAAEVSIASYKRAAVPLSS